MRLLTPIITATALLSLTLGTSAGAQHNETANAEQLLDRAQRTLAVVVAAARKDDSLNLEISKSKPFWDGWADEYVYDWALTEVLVDIADLELDMIDAMDVDVDDSLAFLDEGDFSFDGDMGALTEDIDFGWDDVATAPARRSRNNTRKTLTTPAFTTAQCRSKPSRSTVWMTSAMTWAVWISVEPLTTGSETWLGTRAKVLKAGMPAGAARNANTLPWGFRSPSPAGTTEPVSRPACLPVPVLA